MRIKLTSQFPYEACTRFYLGGLSRVGVAFCADFNELHDCDVCLFMSYPGDIDRLRRFKEMHPEIPCGVVDPRDPEIFSCADIVDFLVVDSLEMSDYWSGTRLPIIEYAEYPEVPVGEVRSRKSRPVIIGYHGNLTHLDCMAETVSRAIEELGKKHHVELWVVYSFSGRGEWRYGLPRGVTIRHINWHEDVYRDELGNVDIGLVPGVMTNGKSDSFMRQKLDSPEAWQYWFREDDYVLRFKMSANPGRIIVWGRLGIPVVADFFPSAMQCINHGENGLLACSRHGWHAALESLIQSPALRSRLANSMQNYVLDKFDMDAQNQRFMESLDLLVTAVRNQ